MTETNETPEERYGRETGKSSTWTPDGIDMYVCVDFVDWLKAENERLFRLAEMVLEHADIYMHKDLIAAADEIVRDKSLVPAEGGGE